MTKKIDKRFICIDCKVHTGKIGEYYMLENDTWNKIHDSIYGMLCIGCCEKRLGRKLTKSDFHDCFLNRHTPCGAKSLRLVDRLNNEG